TLRLTVDFGIARCLAAAVKLPASATAAKTAIAFRSGRWYLIVLFLEQSFQESYSGPTSRTMADLAHDIHLLDGGDRRRGRIFAPVLRREEPGRGQAGPDHAADDAPVRRTLRPSPAGRRRQRHRRSERPGP